MDSKIVNKIRNNPKKVALAALIVALVIARVWYEILVLGGLNQSAAFYIGLPALIALVLTFGTRSSSFMVLSSLGITLILLMGIIVLQEGVVCILMASPIFFLIVAIISWIEKKVNGKAQHLLLLPIFLMSMEGTTELLSFDRTATASATQIIHSISPIDIRRTVSQVPTFDQELPAFLRLGFPTPTQTEGSGLEIGDRRHITFTMGELTLEIVEVTEESIRFDFVHDSTPISQWLTWEAATVKWETLPDDSVEVTWSLTYQRDLDPAFYFGPLESYGVHLAAEYLLETVAIPH